MQITDLWIRNFKSIENMHISQVENALILVGKNNTGKTAVLDAIRTVGGVYQIEEDDFHEDYANIQIGITLSIEEEDLRRFQRNGMVSSYRRFGPWYKTFCSRIPSFVPEWKAELSDQSDIKADAAKTLLKQSGTKVTTERRVSGQSDRKITADRRISDQSGTKVTAKGEVSDQSSEQSIRREPASDGGQREIPVQEAMQQAIKSGEKLGGILTFTFIANRNGKIRYADGVQKDNTYIPEIFPPIYYVDSQRNILQLQEDLLLLQEDGLLKRMRSGGCIFNQAKLCDHCFSCIGLINQKKPEELDAFEAAKLLDYKLYQLNLDDFSTRVNENFRKNGGQDRIIYSMNRDIERMLSVTAEIEIEGVNTRRSIERLGKGMRSVYMLSLLETYGSEDVQNPGIILVEEPELFLHPKLQKTSGDILYRLARKNQVIFSTHSANLLPNFNSRQIRQIILDETGSSNVREHTDISVILDDLGYSAGDLMNVDFVFIVEGRQDKSRLPLLLRKYYSEVYDENGGLKRVAIITTNSCTNIRTYANLKYMNQIYLKDNFLMIRDGDGKNRKELKRQLCRYYEEQDRRDVDHLPRVTEKNVLILKYYSFENYFFNPEIMAQLKIIKRPEDFYRIFLNKWKEYLYKLSSGQKLRKVIGKDFETVEDVKNHMEEIRIHLRGHNLYDIFYGRFRKREEELLQQYIDLAPREDFKDILEAIDGFLFFEGRKIKE